MGASRGLGGRDESRALSNINHRWVPPSSLQRDALASENHHDFIFRRVRGILNKLTPDKFRKLGNDILGVGLDSSRILKGVILLIFEKALDEPKYSSMYAQLCKRLSEQAPNFDPSNAPCTFRRLLLSKCQDEFENRSRATDVFDNAERQLTAEEEEQRHIAKRKMLGNIKFIGELGKLEILHESILHRCIQQLLEKKKKRTARDMAEDLECLCQIMKTCGRILDTDKAKSLMNQYFERMAILATNQELPSRIRFMLEDVIELRRKKWIPRKMASSDSPRTIQQIRDEVTRSGGIYIPGSGQGRMLGQNSQLSNIGFFPAGSKGRIGMDDVFGSFPSLGTGPGVISHDRFDYSNNFETNGFGGNYRPRQQFSGGQQQHYQNRQFSNQQNFSNKQQNIQPNQQQQNHNVGTNDLPPRFKKMFSHQSGGTGSEEVSLRPSANSMMLKPKTPGVLPKSAIGGLQGAGNGLDLSLSPHSNVPSQNTIPPQMRKDADIIIKQASQDKPKANRKDKGPSKEELVKKIDVWAEELLTSQVALDILTLLKEFHISERLMGVVVYQFMMKTMDRTESERELVSELLSLAKNGGLVTSAHFLDGVADILRQITDIESEIPLIKSNIAGFFARAVGAELVSLLEAAELMDGGAHHPLFLLILLQLHKLVGKTQLTSLFSESGIGLLSMLPEVDRTKDRLAQMLDDRCISFLCPLLRIQSELWKQLQADANPTQFYKWIKENLDPDHYTDKGFISALVTVIVKYITQESTLGEDVDQNQNPDRTLQDKERELVERFRPVLQAFLHDFTHLQVTAVYALQVFCFSNQFPKGMLLRWFVNLYNMEIVEEEAFLKWKEDVNDDYPGKGKALFQVNQWLTWLEEAESEEDEEGEEREDN